MLKYLSSPRFVDDSEHGQPFDLEFHEEDRSTEEEDYNGHGDEHPTGHADRILETSLDRTGDLEIFNSIQILILQGEYDT